VDVRSGSWFVRVESLAAAEGDRRLRRREPLLTFDTFEPLLQDSRVVAWVRRLVDLLFRDAVDARIAMVPSRVTRMFPSTPAAVVAYGAWLIAVAALTHLMMLLFVERYHFPSRTALVLPIVTAVVALVAIPLSAGIARAIADRRDR
jgi:hypothetical protein